MLAFYLNGIYEDVEVSANDTLKVGISNDSIQILEQSTSEFSNSDILHGIIWPNLHY